MFDCSSTTFSTKNATTTSKSVKNVTTTTSRTIMKVRRSTLKILNMKTRKATTKYSECDDKEETCAYYNETL